MIYHKFKVDERTTVINELNEDELVTFCGGCRKEMEITLEDVQHIHETEADFCGTTFFCTKCTSLREESKANDS